MNEVWKPVVGYEGLYEVSNTGNIRSLNWRRLGITRNLYLKKHKDGYRQVELFLNGTKKMLCVHRLVAEAFIPNPNNLPQVNHIDYDRANNTVGNLEWCTAVENVKHSLANMSGGLKITRKEKISQFSLDGNHIRDWDLCRDISNKLHYNQTSIWECCEGKRKTAYGYLWRYAIDYNCGTEVAI